MKLIMLGAPGAGKGTQAALLAELYNIPHISTGDIFRDNIKRETPIGKEVKLIIDAGALVPDELTIALVKDRIAQEDCKNGYLLDGFPRNLYQAESLESLSPTDKAVNVDIDQEILVGRLAGAGPAPTAAAPSMFLLFPPRSVRFAASSCRFVRTTFPRLYASVWRYITARPLR